MLVKLHHFNTSSSIHYQHNTSVVPSTALGFMSRPTWIDKPVPRHPWWVRARRERRLLVVRALGASRRTLPTETFERGGLSLVMPRPATTPQSLRDQSQSQITAPLYKEHARMTVKSVVKSNNHKRSIATSILSSSPV